MRGSKAKKLRKEWAKFVSTVDDENVLLRLPSRRQAVRTAVRARRVARRRDQGNPPGFQKPRKDNNAKVREALGKGAAISGLRRSMLKKLPADMLKKEKNATLERLHRILRKVSHGSTAAKEEG